MTNKTQETNHWINKLIINLKTVLYKQDRKWASKIIFGEVEGTIFIKVSCSMLLKRLRRRPCCNTLFIRYN